MVRIREYVYPYKEIMLQFHIYILHTEKMTQELVSLYILLRIISHGF